MKNRYVCSSCGGLCDAGEFEGGRCLECRQEEREKEVRKEWTRQMLKRNLVEQADGQLAIGGCR